MRSWPRRRRRCDAAAGAIACLSLALCSQGCGERQLLVVSPDHRHTAEVTRVAGGATEPTRTFVTIHSTWGRRHVAFQSKTDDARTVRLIWVSPSRLRILTPPNEHIFTDNERA
jgi:hypothetical protein